MPAREELLNSIIDMTQKMLDHAQQQEWEALNLLEEKRRTLITAFFDQQKTLSDAHQISIQTIIQLDEKTQQLVTTKRNDVGQSIQSLGQKRHVHSAYADTLKYGQ